MTLDAGQGVIPVFTLGDRLRKARELTGLGQTEFAAELGVSRGTVSNAEGDHVQVRTITLRMWSMRTGVPVLWLETGQTPTNPEDPRQTGLQPTVVLPLRAVAA